jgi:hypothetical protein
MNRRDDALKRPSFSIAEMMVVVAILAMDCLAIRMAGSAPAIPFLVFGGLPMQSVLVIGLLRILRRRGRTGRPFPFLLGFVVVGWIAHVIYVFLCTQAARAIDVHLGDMLGPMLRATGFQRFSVPDWIIRISLGMSYLAAPQLVIALVGGWIWQTGSKRTAAEPVPTNL